MGNDGGVITAHEAIVKTAQVEVKTLTIKGKQVTLSVFRQLQQERVLDPISGNLLGMPWGKVNYFWGDCIDEGHLHIVWKKGTELRRSCIGRASSYPWGFRYSKAINESNQRLEDLKHLYNCYCKYGKDCYWQIGSKRLRDTIASLDLTENDDLDLIWLEQKTKGLTDLHKEYIEEEEIKEARYQANYLMLENLDQLFIAV
tara:strand:- start:324 stop:926 length:603 start_codon:yes stop_codon:yes gene_type:complete